MTYRIVLILPFDLALVSRALFTEQSTAREYIDKHYASFPAMEVRTQDEVDALTERVVLIPEKEEAV